MKKSAAISAPTALRIASLLPSRRRTRGWARERRQYLVFFHHVVHIIFVCVVQKNSGMRGCPRYRYHMFKRYEEAIHLLQTAPLRPVAATWHDDRRAMILAAHPQVALLMRDDWRTPAAMVACVRHASAVCWPQRWCIRVVWCRRWMTKTPRGTTSGKSG